MKGDGIKAAEKQFVVDDSCIVVKTFTFETY